jgi:hypothetical protein
MHPDSSRHIDFQYLLLSNPILSTDGKFIAIEIHYCCIGMLCGQGISYLFEKKDGEWAVLDGRVLWIS